MSGPDYERMISFRLPADMVAAIDDLAAGREVRRSDVVRAAVTAYIRDQTGQVGPDDAEHALEVLRKVVAKRFARRRNAA